MHYSFTLWVFKLWSGRIGVGARSAAHKVTRSSRTGEGANRRRCRLPPYPWLPPSLTEKDRGKEREGEEHHAAAFIAVARRARSSGGEAEERKWGGRRAPLESGLPSSRPERSDLAASRLVFFSPRLHVPPPFHFYIGQRPR